MKKSLIAMALMCGAVVIVASCKKKNEDDCTKCTVKVTNIVTPVASLDYPDQQCKETFTIPTALGVKDAAVASNKGGKYVCE